MLSIRNLPAIRDNDVYTFEALVQVQAALNQLMTKVGTDVAQAAVTDPNKAVSPPPAPPSLMVTVARGIFLIGIGAVPGAASSIQYFLEASTTSDFAAQNTTIYPLGSSPTAMINRGKEKLYWRARAKYLSSDYGPYAYFGTQANPTALLGTNANSNYTNNTTVDSIDAGTSATIRIYGPGGVGTNWSLYDASATATASFAPGSITGRSYSTLYFVYWDGSAYQASTTAFAAMPDGIIYVGKVTTVASGGGGGAPGGGGGGGGGGCCEIGTQIELPQGSVAHADIKPCKNWIDIETEAGQRLALAPHTLVSVFVPVESLVAGHFVEVSCGNWSRLKSLRFTERPSHKIVLKVSPGQTYLANGIRVHNLKP